MVHVAPPSSRTVSISSRLRRGQRSRFTGINHISACSLARDVSPLPALAKLCQKASNNLVPYHPSRPELWQLFISAKCSGAETLKCPKQETGGKTPQRTKVVMRSFPLLCWSCNSTDMCWKERKDLVLFWHVEVKNLVRKKADISAKIIPQNWFNQPN